jgi:HK97 family phage portal protein
MGLMDKVTDYFAVKIEARRQTSESRWDRSLYVPFGQQSEAAIPIVERTATGQDTAWACASLTAKTIAALPGDVLAPRSDDRADGNAHLPNHTVNVLLQRAPNPEMTAMNFKESLMMAAQFHGNGYAEIQRDQAGNPIALWPLHPERVQACRDSDSGALYYEIDGLGGVTLDTADMFHLAGPSLGAGSVGFSIIALAKNDLGEALAQGRYASNFIRNQAAPSGIVTVDPGIKAEGMRRLRAEMENMYAGARKAGRIFLADKGIDFKQIGVTPQDAEFLAQRRFSVETICRWFGVPPQMIGDNSKQTFANYEQAGLNFLQLSVLPWVVRFEQEVNRKLLNKKVSGRQMPFFKINTAAVVRANLQAQYAAFSLGRQWGWLSVNDIRQLLDLEPIGPEGDVYLTPMNMQSVGDDPRLDPETDTTAPALSTIRRIK